MFIIETRAPKSAVTGKCGEWHVIDRRVYATRELAVAAEAKRKKVFHAMEYRITELEFITE